ncbi:MAG: toprim domain-containing protein [Gammaproteobacteria bacterium]|nr:toprim domain-containing protein [Gammaproteobacteria bacterium]
MVSINQAPLQTALNKSIKNDSTLKSITSKAQDRWEKILSFSGINNSLLKKETSTCPIWCGLNCFRFIDNGFGSFICYWCESGDGLRLLQLYRKCDLATAFAMVSKALCNPIKRNITSSKHISSYLNIQKANQPNNISKNDLGKRRKSLNLIWNQGKPISIGDPIDHYLRLQGIKLDTFPSILRFHPQLSYYGDHHVLVGAFPAIVTLVQDKDNKCVTIHRTYLGSGCLAKVHQPRKLMAPIIPGSTVGATIKLYGPNQGKLALTAGIERALAFFNSTQTPVWAALSEEGMDRILLPKEVNEVLLVVSEDNWKSQRAINLLHKRLISEGRKVKKIKPKRAEQLIELLPEVGL